MLIFFSSDIYNLYRKDILSSLSLPKGYTVHFRYPIDIIPDYARNPHNTIGKRGIITYVKGNQIILPERERKVEFLPIRTVRVQSSYRDDTTGLIHFHLELDEFITTSDIPKENYTNPNLEFPPYKLIYRLDTFSSVLCSWHAKIEELINFDNLFQNILIFNINIRYAQPWLYQTAIKFDTFEKSSFFHLDEDEDYLIDIAIYNTSVNELTYEDYSIKVEYNSEDFFITNPERIVVGANKDYRTYKLVTKEIKSIKSSNYIRFQSLQITNDKEKLHYEELIRINIKRSLTKLRKYILVSVVAFTGTTMIPLAIGQFNKTGGNSTFGALLLVGAFMLFVLASSLQFHFLNKRN